MLPQRLAWLEKLAWTLIYGGLASAVLGLFVGRQDGGDALGATLITVGAIAVVVGIVSIYIRSRAGSRGKDRLEE